MAFIGEIISGSAGSDGNAHILLSGSLEVTRGGEDGGEIRMRELDANGDHYVGFSAPDSLAANTVYEMPAAFPGGDKVLMSSQTGVLSWVSGSAGSGAVSAVANGSDNYIATFSSSDALNGEAGLTFASAVLTLTADDSELRFGAGNDVVFAHDNGTGMDVTSAGDLDIVSTAGNVTITSQVDEAAAIYLRANAGSSETIKIHADQGTGEGNGNASIELVSDVGGICLTATGLTGVMTGGNSDAAVQLHAAGGGIGIRSAANLEGCIQIEADGGANETISIHSDQGTGVNAKAGSTDASINLISDVGGIGLYTALNGDNAITLETNGGADETIQIRSNLGTGVATADIANAVNASIALVSDVGGIAALSGLNGEGAIYVGADAGANETVRIHSHQGTGVNAKGGITDASINLVSDVGGIGLYTALNGDNAITLEANGGANETIQIRSNQGTGVATADIANAVNASIAVVSDAGGIAIMSGLNADSSIWIGADGGDDETIVIHSHQGTGADSITLKSDEGGITVNLASGQALAPATTNINDLGTASLVWRNIYTGDLHLTNDRGNWTIVEEADMLTIRNNKNGKWYQMNMTEIDPTGRDEGMAPTS